MNRIDYDEHILIKPGDKIHLIKYYDHGQTQESIEDIREKPLLLWCIGKIVNMHTDDPFYAIINSGAFQRYQKPNWKNIIQKGAIKSMKEIYIIPEDVEQI